mmetsp:Transcript_1736/g.5263  ORF Transcript_1736/g.5263 Transcript_1736/m.5263 type:complete len:232 (-) Transcript_1736:31-726(-)
MGAQRSTPTARRASTRMAAHPPPSRRRGGPRRRSLAAAASCTSPSDRHTRWLWLPPELAGRGGASSKAAPAENPPPGLTWTTSASATPPGAPRGRCALTARARARRPGCRPPPGRGRRSCPVARAWQAACCTASSCSCGGRTSTARPSRPAPRGPCTATATMTSCCSCLRGRSRWCSPGGRRPSRAAASRSCPQTRRTACETEGRRRRSTSPSNFWTRWRGGRRRRIEKAK